MVRLGLVGCGKVRFGKVRFGKVWRERAERLNSLLLTIKNVRRRTNKGRRYFFLFTG